MKSGMTWTIGGDLGDSVMSLALMHAVDGRHIIRCVDRPKVNPFVVRVHLLKRLFESQPYVERVECSDEKSDVDLTDFRKWHSSTTCLYAAQACEFSFLIGQPLLVSGVPWMSCPKNKTFDGKVIVARSSRYQNRRFPWKQIVDHYGTRIVFIGIPEEHVAFCSDFGTVPHLQVKDFYEMASAMAGCSLVVANQSSPHAVAMALGCRIIQETCDWQPDVIVPRENVQYVCDGSALLPDVSDSGTKFIPPVQESPPAVNTNQVPTGFWQWEGIPPSPHFGLQVELIKQKEKCSDKEAEAKLILYNVRRVPEFFNRHGTESDPMNLFKTAFRNAFGENFCSGSLTHL